MIKPLSVQHEFSLIWSRDPAVNLPEPEPDATDEKRLEVIKEAARLFNLARDTGDYRSIVREGQTPTTFSFKDPSRGEWGWIYGEQQHSSVYGRPLSEPEFTDLIFRVAVRGVVNFGEHKVTRKRNAHGVWLADESIIEAIFDNCGPGPIVEFVGFILSRAGAARPLS